MFRKWKESDSRKLRALEKEFELIKTDHQLLRAEIRSLRRKLNEKEITHTQRIKVEVIKPVDYDGWLP
ncbi:hypothetical protein PZE06_23825 [Robertmurraya sp. DFI.2.37]|uniref:hypothetical protein n=1 Tax=Robertmurraya sp. DFI.2.37 TaxID=3031819 RepID=UPI001247BA89|nr:hypothetical protein [Robertmurraya sp. DFI.2.37]MDF1511164.1 hypothetical protein [Robertmurraya sp. DFI.2.37]